MVRGSGPGGFSPWGCVRCRPRARRAVCLGPVALGSPPPPRSEGIADWALVNPCHHPSPPRARRAVCLGPVALGSPPPKIGGDRGLGLGEPLSPPFTMLSRSQCTCIAGSEHKPLKPMRYSKVTKRNLPAQCVLSTIFLPCWGHPPTPTLW